MRTNLRGRLRRGGLVAGAALLLALAIPLTAYFAQNDAKVSPKLAVESWATVSDGAHNLNSDLIYWNGNYYLAHASAPEYFGSSQSRIKIWSSPDCRTWTTRYQFYINGEDIRDPKFAPISGRLFLYVLKNREAIPAPYGTQYAFTEDGYNWEALRDIKQEGWLLGRPRSADGRVWYAPAWWRDGGKSILLTSRNGQQWEEVSIIHEGDHASETDLSFMPDGRLMAVARLDASASLLGDTEARTLIAVSEAPFRQWSATSSYLTRLDTPNLFSFNGEVYAVGRHNPGRSSVIQRMGSILGRKRTSLFRMTPDGMEWLSDLPSGGDTAGAGVVQKDGTLYISYYTSPTGFDWPWVFGMYFPTEIRTARFPAQNLKALP